MTGEARILASAVAETQNLASLRHYAGIPSFPYSVTGVSTIPFTGRGGRGVEDVIMQNKANFCEKFQVPSRKYQAGTPQFTVPGKRPTPSLRAGPAAQNKANFREAQLRLTAGQEKGYVKQYELCICENKANLPGRACSVPVRASVGAGLCARPGQPRRVAPTSSRPGGLGAKQSQFPAARIPAAPLRVAPTGFLSHYSVHRHILGHAVGNRGPLTGTVVRGRRKRLP